MNILNLSVNINKESIWWWEFEKYFPLAVFMTKAENIFGKKAIATLLSLTLKTSMKQFSGSFNTAYLNTQTQFVPFWFFTNNFDDENYLLYFTLNEKQFENNL